MSSLGLESLEVRDQLLSSAIRETPDARSLPPRHFHGMLEYIDQEAARISRGFSLTVSESKPGAPQKLDIIFVKEPAAGVLACSFKSFVDGSHVITIPITLAAATYVFASLYAECAVEIRMDDVLAGRNTFTMPLRVVPQYSDDPNHRSGGFGMAAYDTTPAVRKCRKAFENHGYDLGATAPPNVEALFASGPTMAERLDALAALLDHGRAKATSPGMIATFVCEALQFIVSHEIGHISKWHREIRHLLFENYTHLLSNRLVNWALEFDADAMAYGIRFHRHTGCSDARLHLSIKWPGWLAEHKLRIELGQAALFALSLAFLDQCRWIKAPIDMLTDGMSIPQYDRHPSVPMRARIIRDTFYPGHESAYDDSSFLFAEKTCLLAEQIGWNEFAALGALSFTDRFCDENATTMSQYQCIVNAAYQVVSTPGIDEKMLQTAIDELNKPNQNEQPATDAN